MDKPHVVPGMSQGGSKLFYTYGWAHIRDNHNLRKIYAYYFSARYVAQTCAKRDYKYAILLQI